MIEVFDCNSKHLSINDQPSPAQYHPLQRSKMVAESRTSRYKPNPECQGLKMGWSFTFHQSNDSNQSKVGVSSGSELRQSSDLNSVQHPWRVMTMPVHSCGICKRSRAGGCLWMQISHFYSIIAQCCKSNKKRQKRRWHHRSVLHYIRQCRWYEQVDSEYCNVWKWRSTEEMSSRCWMRILTQIRDPNLLQEGF